jgi:hypothetical protein
MKTEEPQITYPVTMPLSVFREAELAAKHDRKTFNEYILEGIRSDLENFHEDVDGFPSIAPRS